MSYEQRDKSIWNELVNVLIRLEEASLEEESVRARVHHPTANEFTSFSLYAHSFSYRYLRSIVMISCAMSESAVIL